MPLGLYLIQYVLQAGWGLSASSAVIVAATPLMLGVATTLYVLRKWEVKERATFLALAAART